MIKYGMVGLAGICLSQAAVAQNDSNFDVTPTNIAVRLGIGLPIDTALSDYGSPLIDLGAEYQFPHSLLPSGDTYFSLDYETVSTSFNGHGVWPIAINQRWYFGPGHADGTRTYGFLGVGAAIVNLYTSNTVIAGRLGVGANLGPQIFFETCLLITDTASGASGDNISASIGYRF